MKNIIIGLTGNIASGKSEVEKILSSNGFSVFDLDKICASLYQSDEDIKKRILEAFNTLDKKKIADIIFSDSDKKKILENIIHPKLKEIILELSEKEKNLVISGALLYEAGFEDMFDKIIFIDASYEIRLNRLIKRNNLSLIKAKKRLNSQTDRHKSKADFIIENQGTINDLQIKIKEALELL